MTATLAFVLATVPAADRLVDSTGEPVRGATVRAVGGVASAVTDEEGRFQLDPEPSPPFDLVVLGSHGHSSGVKVADAGSRILRRNFLHVKWPRASRIEPGKRSYRSRISAGSTETTVTWRKVPAGHIT
jgi:Carboxypeptidase regulatory-like domain